MGSNMALKQPGSGEALAADLALAGQGVRARVHLQRRQRRVALVAELAGERLLNLVGSVQLLMLDVTRLS